MRHDEYLAHDATALAQLARVQPRVNAVCRLMEREARAQLERPLAGALAGVPLPIKDGIQDYAGVPTSYGSRAMQRIVPKEHSAIVRRLLGAGAVIFAKTNLPEFGLKGVTDPVAFGRTANPWDPGRTPGGSSGGAAAAGAPASCRWRRATTAAGRCASRRRAAGCSR